MDGRTQGRRHRRTTRKHIASAGAYRRRRLKKGNPVKQNSSHILQKSNGLQYLVQPPPILAPIYSRNPPQNDAETDTPLTCPSVSDKLAEMYAPRAAPTI